MTGFSSNPRAASSARGASSRRSGQTTSGTTGWGSSGADGPGWGSSGADNPGWGSSGADGPGWGSSGADGPGWGSSGADGPGWGSSGADNPGWGSSGADNPGWGSSTAHNEKPSDGWSNVPDASGEKAFSSQRDTQAAEWGSSGDGWGAVVTTDLGPDWGDTSISDQGKKASSATKVAVITDPDALSGGTGAVDNPDAATAATPWSPVTPSIPTSGEVNATHNKPRVEDTPAPAIVELFPWERKTSHSDILFRSLWLSNRPKCDHCVVTMKTISFQRCRARTRWGTSGLHTMHRRHT